MTNPTLPTHISPLSTSTAIKHQAPLTAPSPSSLCPKNTPGAANSHRDIPLLLYIRERHVQISKQLIHRFPPEICDHNKAKSA